MVENDAQLIRRILSGDDEAFSTLVQKHQKGVHALVWRKVNDFQYAEEITQDTFLQAYKKLSTLKNPHQFAGWLYVIANRLCINWLQRHKPAMQSLEDTSVAEIEESSYIRYASEQREAEGTEYRHEIAQKLLAKLPESERTVVTLYYLGEMTAKEISKFLGVSVNTITSRLRRARERLQEDQERLGSGSPRRHTVTHQPHREHHAANRRPETDTASGCKAATSMGCFWYRHASDCLAIRRDRSIPRPLSETL